MQDESNEPERHEPPDPVEFADRVLDAEARDSEQYDDWQLRIRRGEDRLRYALDHYIERVLSLPVEDADTFGLDGLELAELKRRVEYLARHTGAHAGAHPSLTAVKALD